MRNLLITLLSALALLSSAHSASVEQFLPWVAPNSLVFGTTFGIFRQARPLTTQFSMDEQKTGESFNGSMLETLSDGSMLMYGFGNDNLESVRWAARPSNKIEGLLSIVRSSLLETCGEPASGTTGRVDSLGSVAQIVWEDYRPRADKEYLITLVATSDGIEVNLINESVAKMRGIKTTHGTYEEVVSAVSSLTQPEAKPSKLVDYLAVARGHAQQSKDAVSEETSRNSSEAPLRSPPKVLATDNPKQTSSSLESPEPTNSPSSTWLWLLGGLILGVLAFLANVMRRHRK